MGLTKSCSYLKWVIRVVNFKKYAFIKGEVHFLKSFGGLEVFICISLSLLMSVHICLPVRLTLERHGLERQQSTWTDFFFFISTAQYCKCVFLMVLLIFLSQLSLL